MRDEDRLREKRQISLEDRQVWALGFSAVLLLGGVFVVGVLTGRRMAAEVRPQTSDLRSLHRFRRRRRGWRRFPCKELRKTKRKRRTRKRSKARTRKRTRTRT